MALDLSALLQRIIHRALVKSAGNDAFVDQNGEVNEELIADALGHRLAQMLMSDGSQSSDIKNGPMLDYSTSELAHYEELMERNSALAAALGACDCWGEQTHCTVCHGAGRPGWTLPDKRLFSNFVRPAINTVRRLRASPHGAATQDRRDMKGE